MSNIRQRQVQKLLQKLSPQQIQMIKLLELPVQQLEQRIKQEIEENPVLEDDVVTGSEEDNDTPEDISVDEYLNDETPAYKYNAQNYSRDNGGRTVQMADGHSLQEYLLQQLGFKDISPRMRTIAQYIIGSIDDDGYLRRDMEAISDDIAFSMGMEAEPKEIEEALGVIHTLEPPGIGARNLQESLLMQLESKPIDTPARQLAHRILSDYFTEFAKKHYEKLMTRLGVDEDEFRDAIDEIVRLSPKPGNLYSGDKSDAQPYIIPDFVLDNTSDKLRVTLNTRNMPDIKINKQYVDMIQQMASSKGEMDRSEAKETLQFVKSRIESAKWFMSAIRQRRDTLNKVMQAILDYQYDYFEDGDQSKLRPMILKDIADRTGLDVSTVSRVVNSKYIQTHFGIIPLKALFSEAMQTEGGEEVSSHEIKNILKECIANEDKRKPVTDEALMDLLNSKGYQIARRTVAKYREMLGIPVARLRREL
jgi:RNA polymerase sigma-54 factor